MSDTQSQPPAVKATRRPAINVNHVGITVPNIFAAIDWYVEQFGCDHLMGPRLLDGESSTAEVRTVFGPSFRRAYQAHLVAGNGVGLELFQFVDPPEFPPDAAMTYRRPGPWHLCFTDADVDGIVERIVAAGGKRLTPTEDFVPGRPYQLCYCADPWSNTIEILSHPYAEVFADWPQPGMTAETTWVRRPSADG